MQDKEIMFFDAVDSKTKTLWATSYPDGMPCIVSHVEHHRAASRVERVLLRPTSLDTFTTCMFWIDALVARGNDVPELILPFFPGARQDRLNSKGDVLFTAKSVAKMINDRHFPRVIVLDPHSDVVPALLDRCSVVTAADIMGYSRPVMQAAVKYTKSYDAVVSPDAGAEKRASAIATNLGIPHLHAWKTRNVMDGSISGFGCEPIPRSVNHILVVDDICDGGGTFEGLREVLPWPLVNEDISVDLFVTHGIFSKGTRHLASKFNNIFCTDSIVGRERNEIIEVSVCMDLLRKGYC